LEKRGRIYRSGLVAKGTPQAHRFPRHPAEMIICRTLATYKGRPLLVAHRVTEGGRPPPVPTERGVRISRTTLFGSRFTAPRGSATPDREDAV
jgi:hypothetical protein